MNRMNHHSILSVTVATPGKQASTLAYKCVSEIKVQLMQNNESFLSEKVFAMTGANIAFKIFDHIQARTGGL
jgi:hypothetical protein